MEVYYFTYTGTCKELARELGERLAVPVKPVETLRLPYFLWLAMSFFPNLPFPARFSPPDSNELIFCFPKWTVNCPPATYFLKKLKDFKIKKLTLIILYKGWGEKPFVSVYSKLIKEVAETGKVYILKKQNWQSELKELLGLIKL